MLGEVLTVEEAARLLKVTRNTVRRWCNSGKLSAFKIGRAWRIPASALARIVAQAEVKPDLSVGARRVRPVSAGATRPPGPQDLWSNMVRGYESSGGKEGGGGEDR